VNRPGSTVHKQVPARLRRLGVEIQFSGRSETANSSPDIPRQHQQQRTTNSSETPRTLHGLASPH